MDTGRIIKIIAAICFALIAAIVIILVNSPATGYESSIYTATPSIVWVGLIFSFICGLGIIFHQLYNKKQEESRLWVIGILLVVASLLAIFSVHIFRGYVHLGGDVTTHLSWTQTLISRGHIAGENFYPITHLYMALFSQVCNIDLMALFLYVPIIFNALFIVFIYLLARVILPDKGQVILATVAGALLPLALNLMYATTFNLAYTLMPLAFLLGVRRAFQDTPPKPQFAVLLLVMMILLPVFHPVAGIGFLLMLLTIALPNRFYNLLTKNKQPASSGYRFITPAVLLLFVWSVTWLTSFYVWEYMIRNIHTIVTEGGRSGFGAMMGDVSYVTQYGYGVVGQFFKQYAVLLLYGILAIVSFPILLKKLSSSGNLRYLFSLYGPLAVYILMMGVSLAPGGGFFLGRTLQYALMICAIFVGFVSYEFIKRARSASGKGYLKKMGLCLLVAVLIAVSINEVFTAYGSRYQLVSNDQITVSEIEGMNWFIANKQIDVPSLYVSVQCYRIKYLCLTPEEAAMRGDIPGWPPIPRPPYHFNYDNQNRLGESYKEANYMVLNQQDRLLYTEVWPEIAEYRFWPQDFERLENDPSVDKPYANGGLDVWYIHPLAQDYGY